METSVERTVRRIVDPLSEETRKTRRALLGWSLLAFAITAGGLFPQEVTTLGLKVTPGNKATLLGLLAAILVFQTVAFLVYASSDAVIWYFRHGGRFYEDQQEAYDSALAGMVARKGLSADDLETLSHIERTIGTEWRWGGGQKTTDRIEKAVPWLSWTRGLFDFALPLVACLIALWFVVGQLWVSASLAATKPPAAVAPAVPSPASPAHPNSGSGATPAAPP